MTGAPKLLLDFEELAEAVGVHRATIYRLRERGELPIPVVHVGRSPRVRTVDVERWLEQLADEAENGTNLHNRTPATGSQSAAGVVVSRRAVRSRRSARDTA